MQPADHASKTARTALAARIWLPALAAVALAVLASGWWLTTKSSAPAEVATEQSASEEPFPPGPDPEGPNVVLISIDMLRRDHLSCYGYKRLTSPHIDALAAGGMLFENQISSTSWTLPAHAALFTSLPDSVHGCTRGTQRLSDKLVTLAERFFAAGYQTAGFFSGPYLHPVFGLGQGFAHYENCTSYAAALDRKFAGAGGGSFDEEKSSHHDVTNPIVYAAVERWLRESRRRKFFLFVHMWDVHYDFLPPPPYDTMFDPDYRGTLTGENFAFNPEIRADMRPRDLDHLLALYDGEIAWTDEHVGKILDLLKELGLSDNTVVALTSDHGTEFFDHGKKGHRRTLYDEVIRTPLILWYPPKIRAGQHVQRISRIIDIGPTLLRLAALDRPVNVLGRHLLSSGQHPFATMNGLAVSELYSLGTAMRTIRTREWKFQHVITTDRKYWYDLTKDPLEEHPLWDLDTGRGHQVAERYKAVLRLLGDTKQRLASTEEPVTVPEGLNRQLESLGYIDRPKP